MSGVEVVRARALDGVPHGFLGRRGGISTGVVAGLNTGLASQDDPDHIAENRRRATEAVLPGARLVSVYQVHSADAVTVIEPHDDALRPHADALVTNRPGLALGILTADCAPVLLADREAGVVGAAHAGWKGAIGGVTDSTILAMEALGASRARIAAAIGPCIARASYEVDEGVLREAVKEALVHLIAGPCIARASYEVDEGFFRRFAQDAAENERFFADGKPGHYQFDLEAYVAHRLAQAGIRTVEMLGEDTYTQPERFYSFRRSTHAQEPDYGRQISIIGLPDS